MNQRLIVRAVELAHVICPTNREKRTSHVAFLTKSGKITTIGWNKDRSHPVNLKHPYHEGIVGIHAELDVCLKSGKEDLSKYEIIVIRIDRLGRACNSRPCNGCMSVINQFGIKEIWYSNSDGIIVKL